MGVVGLAGQAGIPRIPKDATVGMFFWDLRYPRYDNGQIPDMTGYPITLDPYLINAEGKAWCAVIDGYYIIMRTDSSFTKMDTKGVFLLSGTWSTIENFQIIEVV
jgi:hypothetical protein